MNLHCITLQELESELSATRAQVAGVEAARAQMETRAEREHEDRERRAVESRRKVPTRTGTARNVQRQRV